MPIGTQNDENVIIPKSWLIDPFDITNFNRSSQELEVFYLFVVAVAGKKATVIAQKIYDFLLGCGYGGSPFERVRQMVAARCLRENMERVKLGKYRLLEQSYAAASASPVLDLSTASVDELEMLPGIGKKSSRFLIVHSRPDMNLAVIDTHILKYLREVGAPSVPETIPTGNEYLRLERIVLEWAKQHGMKPHVFDLAIWSWYSSGNKGQPVFLNFDNKLNIPPVTKLQTSVLV